uniref:Uncharacterized protein n=1 Tax=Utricularia reniformis TaxID=192314 RepID=A0A1Y0B196_9LAMI|nr:hypothetical protein AEK19_MT0965 [Utricularia reniformis]ART31190.1 hypothetical protein AEK19_MT0965 [Utricularia reniformis]
MNTYERRLDYMKTATPILRAMVTLPAQTRKKRDAS